MTAVDLDNKKLRQLFIDDTPFLDVRAEVEFDKGRFPGAVNVPILENDERHQVGKCYKKQGQEAAVVLGHQLVSGEVKDRRMAQWAAFLQANPGAHLYCWRGGMRSNLTQQWLAESGVEVPLVAGGFKALRRVLLEELEAASAGPIWVIAGKTGVAKTKLIKQWQRGIDLEGHANHRGSSFGRRVNEPPGQIDFENQLAIDILKKRELSVERALLIEDESQTVGPRIIPLPLWQAMCEAPLAVVEMPLDFRVQEILSDYVQGMAAEHSAADSEQGFENYRAYLLGSLLRIKKRLGQERHDELHVIMLQALDQQQHDNSVQAHEQWIEALLEHYYDPMYKYQLDKKKHRIMFSGSHSEVLAWGAEQ
ncbi:MAG: tRNA 2-selenouridine synthase [Paraglaciecola psychrophila]|jgi:tRNA 2-selenouridine synthase